MMREFIVRDAKSGEDIYRGIGANAQEVYEAWRRQDLRPVEYPKPGDLENDDPEVRLNALLLLNDNQDSWIEDDEITMHHVRDF